MCLTYYLAGPHLPYGSTEAAASVPPVAFNRFNIFLKRGGGERDKPGAPICQLRVRTELGIGTEARAKVQLIVQLCPRRGSRGARALSEDPGDHPHRTVR
jgi:hypothetical protein